MYPDTNDLLTRWIDGDGAKAMMTVAGIIPDPIFPPAFRDRQEYLHQLLHTVAYAVGERSANPAAFVEGSEEDAFYSYADRALIAWAKRSSAELEQILESL